MTKQEEIREGLAKSGYERMFDASWDELRHNSVERHLWLMVADTQMAYLHSQGVVLKVEGDEPYCKEHPHEVNLNCFICGIKVGKRHPVSVEPLIKEEK